jgi:hypothetical protein
VNETLQGEGLAWCYGVKYPMDNNSRNNSNNHNSTVTEISVRNFRDSTNWSKRYITTTH